MQARLPWPIGVYCHRAPGRAGYSYYAWRLPDCADARFDAHTKLTAICSRDVAPARLTAAQEQRLLKIAAAPGLGVSAEVMRFIVQDVLHIGSGSHPERQSKRHERLRSLVDDPAVQAEVADAVAAGLDVTTLRYRNGAEANSKFGPFEAELRSMLEERELLCAEERRQIQDGAPAPERLSPLAGSLPQLLRAAEQRMRADPVKRAKLDSGEALIPSISALATRMAPSHPSRATSLRNTGTAGICLKVQTRTAHKQHPDAHYVNAQGVLMRGFMLECCNAGLQVVFVSDDDKCKIPVGLPGFAQAAATRGRRVVAGECSASHSCAMLMQWRGFASRCQLDCT